MVASGCQARGFALFAVSVVGSEIDVVKFEVVLDMCSYGLLTQVGISQFDSDTVLCDLHAHVISQNIPQTPSASSPQYL